jgi:hypothetical protein
MAILRLMMCANLIGKSVKNQLMDSPALNIRDSTLTLKQPVISKDTH